MIRDPAYEALRAAEHAECELRDVERELHRVQREGIPYTGPQIEWQSGNLAATRPEPHIALDREYLDANEIAVDDDYLLSLALAVAQERGYREAVLDSAVTALPT